MMSVRRDAPPRYPSSVAVRKLDEGSQTMLKQRIGSAVSDIYARG
jgi:hypothetical protein